MQSRLKQRGWIGLLALVFVLAVVGLLAKSTLKQYGLLPGGSVRAESDTREGTPNRIPPGRRIVPDNAEPMPVDAMEQVRRLRDKVRDNAENVGDRIDRGTR